MSEQIVTLLQTESAAAQNAKLSVPRHEPRWKVQATAVVDGVPIEVTHILMVWTNTEEVVVVTLKASDSPEAQRIKLQRVNSFFTLSYQFEALSSDGTVQHLFFK